jgi:Glycosyl hydrolases family 39.
MQRNKLFKLIQTVLVGISLPLTVFLVFKQTTFFNRAYYTLVGTKANFVVNLTDAYPYNPPWGYYAQGGEEKSGMLGSVVEPMRSIKPNYIRIDHIYDFYDVVSRSSEGNLNYNWSKLDAEILAITSMGAKPFISLSYMPPAISSGSEVDIPNSWNDWKLVVEATVEHISGKSGLNITNVYYEVWNEPDLFGGFKLTGAKNYLTLYQHANDGAKSAQNVQPFKFGGPATTGLYKTWFTDFLAYAQRNNLRVDFYSWHRYSKFLKDYEDDVTTVKQ